MRTNITYDLTDALLVKKILGGDRHVYTLLIKSAEGLVAQLVFKMINNPSDRKDSV